MARNVQSQQGLRVESMELTGIINRYRRLGSKMAPLFVLALIWLWFLIAILIIGAHGASLASLLGWDFTAPTPGT